MWFKNHIWGFFPIAIMKVGSARKRQNLGTSRSQISYMYFTFYSYGKVWAANRRTLKIRKNEEKKPTQKNWVYTILGNSSRVEKEYCKIWFAMHPVVASDQYIGRISKSVIARQTNYA